MDATRWRSDTSREGFGTTGLGGAGCVSHLLEEKNFGDGVHHRQRHKILEPLDVLARRRLRQAKGAVEAMLSLVPFVEHLLCEREVGAEVGLPEQEHLHERRDAGEDAEDLELALDGGGGEVGAELLVAARLRAEGAHELDDGAVDERRLDLGRILEALGEGWPPIGAFRATKAGSRVGTRVHGVCGKGMRAHQTQWVS